MALPAVLTGVSIGLSVLSGIFGSKARKARKRQAQAEKRAQEILNFRAVREVIRASRLARAASISNAIASGAELGSSGIQGQIGSIGARTVSSLLINRRITDFQTSAFDQSLKADRFSTFSGILGSLASVGFQAAGTFGAPEPPAEPKPPTGGSPSPTG